MPLPPVATVAACGSIITACKSAWELSRMVRNKRKDVQDEKEVHNMLEDLREFVEDGVLTKKHYKKIRYEVATQLATKQSTSFMSDTDEHANTYAQRRRTKCKKSFLH